MDGRGKRKRPKTSKTTKPAEIQEDDPTKEAGLVESEIERLGTSSEIAEEGGKSGEADDLRGYAFEQEPSGEHGPKSVETSSNASGEPHITKGVHDASATLAEDEGRRVRTMAYTENASNKVFEGFSEMTNLWFSPERAKEIAALWIDNSEKMANQALEFQAKATEWSKNTIFAPLFETQNSLARNFVELSTKAARRLCQLE
jgi:hypothetical protein